MSSAINFGRPVSPPSGLHDIMFSRDGLALDGMLLKGVTDYRINYSSSGLPTLQIEMLIGTASQKASIAEIEHAIAALQSIERQIKALPS